MNFFKKILGREDAPAGVEGFWSWFLQQESAFFRTLKGKDNNRIHDKFIRRIMPRLQGLNPRFYCEAGMLDETMAELVITAEGDIKSFVWVEELMAAAPPLPNWKFTALKPAFGSGSIRMNSLSFDSDNIQFFYREDPQYPDEINLILVHRDYGQADQEAITHGTLLFLDMFLGELNAATLIDHVEVGGAGPAGQQPVPMEKLRDFLAWKEKEFVEKYQGRRHDTEKDNYAALEGTDEDGFPSIAILNTDLLDWDARPSHPWMTVIGIDYEKTKGLAGNGMPDSRHLELMGRMEDELTELLPDATGYLNLGRETYKGKRTIFLACKEFRQASKIIADLLTRYQKDLAGSYEIYKDKYWRTMNKYRAGED